MTIIIDSLTSTEACAQSNSVNPRNDTCQITATFHTADPSNPAAQPVVLGDVTSIIFQRNLQNTDRFVLAPFNSPVVMGMIHTNRFDPRDSRLLSVLNYTGPLRSMILDSSSSLYRSVTRNRQVNGETLPPIITDSNGTFRVYLNEYVQYLLVGEIHRPDVIQRRRNEDLLRQALEMPEQNQQGLREVIFYYVDYNRHLLAPEMIERNLRMRDILDLYKRVTDEVATLPDGLKTQTRQLFFRIIQYLYNNEGSLATLRAEVHRLAVEIYRWQPPTSATSAGAARVNLYQVLGNALVQPLLSTTHPPRDNPQMQVEPVSLRQRNFFQSGEGQTRLNLFMRAIHSEESQLNERILRYALASSPLQATFDSIYEPLATQQGRQNLVARITTNTQIVRPAHLTAQWLAENGNLREALGACLFDPAHPERGSISLVRNTNGQAELQVNVPRLIENVNSLYALQLNVVRLRNNVDTLLGANLTNRREFQATVLALLFTLFGDRGQNTSIRAFVEGDIMSVPLRISEPDRGDLERFYAETIRDLGRRDALTEVLAPTIQGVTCAAGVATSISLFATGEHNSGQFSPSLAAGGFLTGAGCAPLIARFLTGTPQNAWRQWVIAGGTSGVALSVVLGFIPLIISSATPPMPMGRPIDGRNPVSEWGP